MEDNGHSQEGGSTTEREEEDEQGILKHARSAVRLKHLSPSKEKVEVGEHSLAGTILLA